MLFFVSLPVQVFSQNDLDIPQLSIQTQSYFHNPDTEMFIYHNAKVEWEEITVESTEIHTTRKLTD